MLNICFGDSECGLLKDALSGEPVSFSYHLLDLGKISANDFEASRFEWISLIFDICSKREKIKIRKEDSARFKKIIDTATKEKEIRIWYASNPYSLCGFYHLVYALQNVDCKIFVVEKPKSIGDITDIYKQSWADVSPRKAYSCLAFEKELSVNERNEISEAWQKLALENADLRLIIDGKITSVPIDYLDEEIMSFAPQNKDFTIGRLVGEMLGKGSHCVSDVFVSSRIKKLINDGRLEIVGKSQKNNYLTTLKIVK